MLGLLLRLIPGFGTVVALAGFAVSILYPTLESFKAIESRSKDDDTQWLSYWVCLNVFLTVERVAWPVLAWVPLFGVLRLLLLGWLVAPQFRGATLIYSAFARPFLLAAAEAAATVPALEPYARPFQAGRRGGAATPKGDAAAAAKRAAAAAAGAALDAAGEEAERPLKAHAQ